MSSQGTAQKTDQLTETVETPVANHINANNKNISNVGAVDAQTVTATNLTTTTLDVDDVAVRTFTSNELNASDLTISNLSCTLLAVGTLNVLTSADVDTLDASASTTYANRIIDENATTSFTLPRHLYFYDTATARTQALGIGSTTFQLLFDTKGNCTSTDEGVTYNQSGDDYISWTLDTGGYLRCFLNLGFCIADPGTSSTHEHDIDIVITYNTGTAGSPIWTEWIASAGSGHFYTTNARLPLLDRPGMGVLFRGFTVQQYLLSTWSTVSTHTFAVTMTVGNVTGAGAYLQFTDTQFGNAGLNRLFISMESYN